MKHVQIPLKINKSDIAAIMQQIIRLALIRRQKQVDTILPELDKAFEDKDPQGILANLEKYLNTVAEESRDIQYAAEMLNFMTSPNLPQWGSGVDTESSSDTEVLEDLSDLEEDGLGIDSRSVEPIAVPSDAS
jgi:hypothetical protein